MALSSLKSFCTLFRTQPSSRRDDLQRSASHHPAYLPHRRPGDAMARLAPLRIPDRFVRPRHRHRRLPPRESALRARHSRPERRGGHGALPLGELLGECRLDVLRGHSPQSHPLDSPLGWVDPRGRVPCRCTNSSDPLLRRAGATRESLGTPDTARTAWVAVAFQVPRCAYQLTLHRLRAHLTVSLAVGRGRRRLPTR